MIIEPASNEMDLKEMETNKVKEIHKVKVKYQRAFVEEILNKEESMNWTQYPLDENGPSILIGLLDSLKPKVIWINARPNIATGFTAEENKKKEGIPIEELVPEEFHEYLDVFSETEANCYNFRYCNDRGLHLCSVLSFCYLISTVIDKVLRF